MPGASKQYYDRLLPTLVMTAAHGDEFAEYAAASTDAYVRAILVREYVRGRRTGWARRVSVTGQPPEIRAAAPDLDTLLDLQAAMTALAPRRSG
jgi:hypothetical protein